MNFGFAEIGGNFEANEAQFKSKTEITTLEMKCGNSGIFSGVIFAGTVSFADASFVDLIIDDIPLSAGPVPELDLTRCSIKRLLHIDRIRVKDLLASSLHVEGPASFIGATIEHSADLSYSNFLTLDLSDSVWPKEGGDFNMRGMSYKYVRAASGDERDSHQALLTLADQSAYTADTYSNLEDFFLRQGYRDDANQAFVAGKRHERREHLHGLGWIGSWLLDWLVGYGRHPWQAGIPCLFFVAFGCLLFSKEKMERQKPEEVKESEGPLRGYSRLWYSLGLFLPFVDLKSDRVWKPKDDQRFLRHYMRVHILLGWILIPILLAAISGLIK